MPKCSVKEKAIMQQFKELGERIREFSQWHGCNPPAPSQRTWKTFADLSAADKEQAVNRLRFYAELHESAADPSQDSSTDRRMVWYAIRKLDLFSPENLMDQIDNEDCVEIYNAEGIQMFRDFNFCRVVAYSLEESCVYPWNALYHRDEHIMRQMQSAASNMFQGAKHPRRLEIPVHYCHQILTPGQPRLLVKFKMISPLFDRTTKQVTSFLATSDIKNDSPEKNSKAI